MFKNYTPHVVNIYSEEGILLHSILPEGVDVRVREEITSRTKINGIPAVCKNYYEITGLPNEEEGVVLIVSVIVLNAHEYVYDVYEDRDDLVCPDTGPDSVIRDESGKILGVKRLQFRS